jgi:hypothetical protein
MSNVCGPYISNLQKAGPHIFGSRFDTSWFPTSFARETVPLLNKLLGASGSSEERKTYPLFPPIFYPKNVVNAKNIFLNPALPKVSHPFIRCLMQSLLRKRRYSRLFYLGLHLSNRGKLQTVVANLRGLTGGLLRLPQAQSLCPQCWYGFLAP